MASEAGSGCVKLCLTSVFYGLITLRSLALAAPTNPAQRPPRLVEFFGMCDASAAVTLPDGRFVVADDEDNVLRIYDAERGGEPLSTTDLSPALALPHKKKTPEIDLEAGTRLGDTAWWLTSHGRNRKGKKKPARFRLFATSAPAKGEALRLLNAPYTLLLEDLLAAPALADFGLREAEAKAPKEPGGLNIEGMTARPDGRSMIIGFRNPVPRGRALLVPLLNPAKLSKSKRARFGAPVLLDLGGRGVRALSWWRGRYLIIAGGISNEAASVLYVWNGDSDRPQPVTTVDLGGLNPEAFAAFEDREEVLLLSDDGAREIAGQRCKDLEDPQKKSFRGAWTNLSGAGTP